jgi:hypothetical protein
VKRSQEVEAVVFADGWHNYFAGHGLESFSDIYNYPGGTTVNKNSRRNVQRISLRAGAAERIFYLKRFERPHLKDTFFAFRNYGRILSQAHLEWENMVYLLNNHIGTCRPVVYGDEFFCCVEKRSLLITEELAGICLADFVALHWAGMSQAAREKLVCEMGELVHKICKARICLPDFYVWHIFINDKLRSDSRVLSVIDLQRMAHNVRGKRAEIENLARLHHSMREEYFEKEMKRLLVESYARAAQIGRVHALIEGVERRSAAISAMRKVQRYQTPSQAKAATLSA